MYNTYSLCLYANGILEGVELEMLILSRLVVYCSSENIQVYLHYWEVELKDIGMFPHFVCTLGMFNLNESLKQGVIQLVPFVLR